MNIKEAIKIIKDEKLQGYNMNEERYNRENEVVLRCENEKVILFNVMGCIKLRSIQCAIPKFGKPVR